MPLHAQLAEVLREKIYAKEWGSQSKIPSEHELVVRYQVSRGTVRHAIDALVDEGLLVRKHGKGTFVAEFSLSHATGARPFSFAEALEQEGRHFVTHVKDEWVTPAPRDVARELDIAPYSDVMFLRRVRTVGGKPIICQESWLSLAECPGLEDCDFTQESLFVSVERCAKRKIKYSRIRYRARIVGREHGELLACDEGAAVLVLEQTISLADRRPVEMCTTWLAPGESVSSNAVQPD